MRNVFLHNLYGITVMDWLVVAIYLVTAISVGVAFAKRASHGVEDFFLAGRKLPWWMAGASMVAAMFASDTPLFHSGNVRDMGLSAAWLFFVPGFGALLAAAWFARLVRRTRVVTDAEFVELRYSGQAPAPFRGFLAVYNGIYVAALTIGWVTIGMTTTVEQILKLPPLTLGSLVIPAKLVVIIILMGLVMIYSMLAGLWGVVMADMFQYVIASVGSIYLAVASVRACGGLDGLRTKLAAIPDFVGSDLHFIPTLQEGLGSPKMVALTLPLLFAWIFVNSASQASSSAHQGQRILACKSEKDASLTYVMFSFCYYVMNGMSWVIIGLASVVVLGATNGLAGLVSSERTFPAMISKLMPVGMLGLMVASIFAAFMSCASVILNWGSSYMINDLYKRFMVRNASQRHYVWASRLASLLLGIGAAWVAMKFDSLGDIFAMVPALLTGSIIVMLARYLWWRTNIWSEISAMVIAPFVGVYVEFVLGARGHLPWTKVLPGYGLWDADKVGGSSWIFYGHRVMSAVIVTTLAWILVTLLTKPTEMEKLKKFYLMVRPSGPGWRHVRRQFDNPPPVETGRQLFWIWCTATLFIFGAILAIFEMIRGHYGIMGGWIVGSVIGAILMNKGLNQINRNAEEYDRTVLAALTPPAAPAPVAEPVAK